MAENGKIPRSKLLARTLELLKNRPRNLTLDQIETDTHLTKSWLTYLLTQRYSEDSSETDTNGIRKGAPSVDRIVVLYEYLTKTKLDVR